MGKQHMLFDRESSRIYRTLQGFLSRRKENVRLEFIFMRDSKIAPRFQASQGAINGIGESGYQIWEKKRYGGKEKDNERFEIITATEVVSSSK
jgi:hypothetical protein